MLSRRSFIASTAAASALSVATAPRGLAASDGAAPDVLILGAGLSGLHAALLLEAEGMRVRVLEGRDRVGGRVLTLDNVPGAPEAGGNGIGAMYARMIARANELGVPLRPIRQRTESTADTTVIAINDQLVTAADWPTFPGNPLPDAYRGTPPWQVAFSYGAAENPLTDISAWRLPENAALDISLAEHMAGNGFSPQAIALAGTNYSFAADAWRSSILSLYQSVTWFTHQMSDPRAFAIEGGNQRLPEAMAAAVRGDILMDTRVVALRDTGSKVEAITADGTRHEAARAIVTVPPQAMRHIHVDPGLTGARPGAVRSLEALSVFQVHYAVEDAYWDADDLPENLWSDGLPCRVMALRYDDADPDRITSVVAFINGHHADLLGNMPEADAIAMVNDEIARIRPAMAAALRPLRTLSWQEGPWSGGAYTAWRPGQIARYADAFAPRPGDRILFAGSQNAALENGMEGAFEAAEAAAFELLI